MQDLGETGGQMPTRWVFALLLGGLGFGPALAGERELHMVAFADQELVYEAGVGAVVSRGKYDVVTRVESIDRKNAWVHVTVFNPSSQPITVPDSAIDASSTAGAIKMLRYADLMKKEKRKQFWENLATGLAAGANSYTAAQSGNYTQRGNFDGRVNTYGSGGYASSNVSGSYTTYGKDPVAAQMATARANAENREMIANVSNAQLARTAALSNSVFRTETIEPGTSYGGSLQLVLPKAIRGQGQAFEIAVTVDGERHPFMVLADATPTAETLQVMAEATALPRKARVDVEVKRMAIVERAIDDPRYQDRVAMLDLDWLITNRFGRRPIAGHLVLEGPEGTRIRMPWTINAETAAASEFSQTGAEVSLLLGSADSDWLLTQAESGAKIRAEFEVR